MAESLQHSRHLVRAGRTPKLGLPRLDPGGDHVSQFGDDILGRLLGQATLNRREIALQ